VNHESFSVFGLSPAILRAVAAEGYTVPTAVQSGVVPEVLAGRDVVACAQTGTGKTAAFVLPLLHRLAAAPKTGRIRALILTPTRELAAQIAERVAAYGRHLDLRHAVVYGGVGQRAQEQALASKPDILVACPGRLLDLMQQGFVDLRGVGCFVLDEADRMLDMGFIPDVRRVVAALPNQRQTLLLSATVPRSVEALIAQLLKNPARVSVRPEVTTAETVDQSVVFVNRAEKRALLQRLLATEGVDRALVFTRTKHGANRLTRDLERAGIGARAIHGNKSQSARDHALDSFRRGTTRVLVATDVAARGIDVDGISHVFNFDLPNVAESYVHRIGRTGRAGQTGSAISFCDRDERPLLAEIERLIRRRIAVSEHTAPAETHSHTPCTAAPAAPRRFRRRGPPPGARRARQW
jgi:ATP-dependent RNA helicase RhlE